MMKLIDVVFVGNEIFRFNKFRAHFNFLKRKHHCRLCGKVICGSSVCSHPIILPSEKEIKVSIRACKNCKSTINRYVQWKSSVRANKMKKTEAPPIFMLYKVIFNSSDFLGVGGQ